MASSWERLLPTVTLGSASNTLESGNFTPKKNLYVVIHAKGISAGGFSWGVQVGTGGTYSTASIYARRRQRGGETSDAASGGSDNWDIMEANKDDYWLEGYISNPDNDIKLGHITNMEIDGGTSDTSNSGEWTVKWNSTDQINCIRLLDGNSATGIDSGSTITVYGADDQSSTPFYPNLPNGTLFEESDTGKIYMFDGSQTWNEIT